MTGRDGSAAPSEAAPTAAPGPAAEHEAVAAVAATITPRADGPLVIEGRVSLTAPDGSAATVDRLFLCRCGASGDKPFCDGSHKRAGFRADGVVPPRKPAP